MLDIELAVLKRAGGNAPSLRSMASSSAGLPGDELLPAATMVFDRSAVIDAPPQDVWPWLVQLGKQRAGWYLPGRVERLLPPGRRASRAVEPCWQSIAVGERIPDYGGREGYLEVAAIDPPHALVYRSERGGGRFTWALLLTARSGTQTTVRLRFRGQLKSRGVRQRAIITGGDFFDWATTALMLRGLNERVRSHP